MSAPTTIPEALGQGWKIGTIYGRVSDPSQRKGNSLSSQLRRMLDYAEREHIFVPEEYIFDDEAFTSATLDRPLLQQVKQLVSENRVTAVLVLLSDRLTREPVDGIMFRAFLKFHKVELHYCGSRGRVDFSTEGEYFSTIEDAANQYWKKKMLEAMNRGRWEKALGASGRPQYIPGQGKLRYGFQKLGTVKEPEVAHHEPYAQVMREAFQLVRDGMTVPKLARHLTERGVPTPGDISPVPCPHRKRPYGHWNAGVLYELLRDESYAGIMWVRTSETYRDPDNPTRWRERPRPRDQWIGVQVPPIVDRETWEAVQKRFNTGRQFPRQGKYADQHILTGRIRCACGGSARVKVGRNRSGDVGYHYYGCNGSDRAVGKSCGTPYFRADHVDHAVWFWVVQLLTDPEEVRRQHEQYLAEQRERQAPLQHDLDLLLERIADEERALENLIDGLAYARTDVARSAIRRRQELAETVLTDLYARRDHMQSQIGQHDADPALYESLFEYGRNLDMSSYTTEQQRQILADLEIVVRMAVEDNRKYLYISFAGVDDRRCLAEESATGRCGLYSGYTFRLSLAA